MNWDDTAAMLLYLAKKSEGKTELDLSTLSIADEVGMSQQSVSRKLKECEDEGLICRKVHGQGITITLTDKATKLLREYHNILSTHFNEKQTISLKGILTAGLGEGKYYMSLEGYKTQFQNKLGYIPFEGTLNLTVAATQLEHFVSSLPSLRLEGFSTPQRTFGGLLAYPVLISFGSKKTQGHLIMPERTVHTKAVAEVICPIHFRKSWKLNNGAVVTLTHG
ncbi:CTP-dependent riboflavin kinase [Candidatus Woesearchaeota archaeon]|nr:CTP-dependent riboflavin kinase [Candidatus Woesearchaeota archaeon]